MLTEEIINSYYTTGSNELDLSKMDDDIDDNDVLNVLISFLTKNPSIHFINLTGHNVRRDGLRALVHFPTLKGLDLTLNDLGNEGARIVATTTTLEYVDLSDNGIDEAAKDLAANKTIKTLKLYNNSNLNDENAKSFIDNNVLEELSLASTDVSNATLLALTKRNKSTKKIRYVR